MTNFTHESFKDLLNEVTLQLTEDLRAHNLYHDPKSFEDHVRSTLHRATKQHKIGSALKHHPHAFPDITLNGYGVEVKFTKQDTWRAVGNSVFEGMRTQGVKKVYVIFGKAGGSPEVRWSPYEDCVTHVRVSHSPRFVIEMVDGRTPLFPKDGGPIR